MGIFALTCLRLCQMGCIGPHREFNDNFLWQIILDNPALSVTGDNESKFLAVLTNYIFRVHPLNESVWLICEAAGKFMRQLESQEDCESVYALMTCNHELADEEEEEEAEVENSDWIEDFIFHIVVCIPKFRLRKH
jgi:hypothetical protein